MLNRKSLFYDIANGARMEPCRWQMQNHAKDALLGRLDLWRSCEAHTSIINSTMWSTNGELLLSASSDASITVSNPFNNRLSRIRTPHVSPILCARFLPLSNNVVSCSSGDGILCYDWSIAKRNTIQSMLFRCSTTWTTSQVITIPSLPNVFITCHDDKTVRQFDIRQQHETQLEACTDTVLVRAETTPTALSLAPISQNYIAVGDDHSCVRIYDRRNVRADIVTLPVDLFPVPPLVKTHNYISSLTYDEQEQHILVNSFRNDLCLFQIANNDRAVFHPEPLEPMVRYHQTVRSDGVYLTNFQRISNQVLIYAQNKRIEQLEEQANQEEQMNQEFEQAGWEEANLDDKMYEMEISDSEGNEMSEEPSSNNSRVEGVHGQMNKDGENSEPVAGPSGIQQKGNKDAIKLTHFVQAYKTLQNHSTCLTEVGFWGNNYVFAGSDCGNVFIWDKRNKDCIMRLDGNPVLVKTVKSHPTLPVLSAGGSQGVLRLFMPVSKYSLFDDPNIHEVKAKILKQQEYRTRTSMIFPNFLNDLV